VAYKRKLIEVALPLEAINREAAREKSIRHGHPSTLHLWWARRPLAAARAVLFAQLVDDPSSRPDEFPTEADQEIERKRLFDLIERLVPWEASNDESVLAEARAEIWKSCDGHPPPILDPFAGGGTIPLEAQRLGLEAHASDVNPVAVLINKALIEIPPKFANMPPVNPVDRTSGLPDSWHGAEGLAADVRYYGKWMRDEAERRIGHLYPKAKLPDGGEATVIAWIWARTVCCPNPACGAIVPLLNSFALSKRRGRETWLRPIAEDGGVRFEIATGRDMPKQGTVVWAPSASSAGPTSRSPTCERRARAPGWVPLSWLLRLRVSGNDTTCRATRTRKPRQSSRSPRTCRIPSCQRKRWGSGFKATAWSAMRTCSPPGSSHCSRRFRG
jgi:putative DNA methylase